MLSALVLGALVLAPGIPLALVVGRGERWSAVGAEALVLGLSWWLLLGLTFSHLGWFDRWQVLLPTAVLVALLAVPAWRAARTVARPSPTWFSAFLAVTTVLALVLRREPFYFLYQIGDFGEYVNRANAVADGGGFIGWFTQGFTVALALTHHALGENGTVELMPFLGTVLVLLSVEVADQLRASPWARAVVAVILTVGVVPVWFGRFPASETLYAVLQVGVVLVVAAAVRRGSHPMAVAGGAVCGLLLVTRGNGILLGPIVILFVLISALVVERRTLQVQCTFLASALVSLGFAFAFNARFSHPYFIAEQLPKFVPDPIFRHLEGMGGLRFAAPRFALLFAVTAGLVVGVRALHARVGPSRQGRVLRILRRGVLPACVAAGVLALFTALDGAGLTDALARYDPVVELLGAVGAGVAMWRFADRFDDVERSAAALTILTGLAFALLYAERLPRPRYAPYFLYWDRYLFSELFPLMVIAAVWAVWLLERSRVPGPAIGVAALGLGALLHADAAVVREQTFMADAYEQLDAVDRLAEDDELLLLFAGVRPEEMPLALCHPNTHRLVASPLASTFGRRFLNLGLAPYAPDPLPSDADLLAAMERADREEAYLVQVAVGDEPAPALASSALDITPIGSTPLLVPLLDRPLTGDTPVERDPLAGCARQGSPRWRTPAFTVTVSRVAR